MKTKKRMILSIFVVLIASVLAISFGVFLPSILAEKGSPSESVSVINKHYETTPEKIPDKNNTEMLPDTEMGGGMTVLPVTKKLDFVMSEKFVEKTQKLSGTALFFELTFRVFVTNNEKQSTTVLANGFSASYQIEDALFFECENLDDKKSIKLEPNETCDFNLKLKFIVTDAKKFNIFDKNNLVTTYMEENVASLNV